MGCLNLPRNIIGTDAFVPFLPTVEPSRMYDDSEILKILEASIQAGFEAVDFSFHPPLVTAIRTLRASYGKSLVVLANPSWGCGVEIEGREAIHSRDRLYSAIMERKMHMVDRICQSPLAPERRHCWTGSHSLQCSLTQREISSICLNKERFTKRLFEMAPLADAFMIGADYADLLVLLGRFEILNEMFEYASAILPVICISHFTEEVLPALGVLPIIGHFIPFGKYTAFFSHDRVLQVASTQRILGVFNILRGAGPNDSIKDLIAFAKTAFPEASLLFGIGETWHAKQIQDAMMRA